MLLPEEASGRAAPESPSPLIRAGAERPNLRQPAMRVHAGQSTVEDVTRCLISRSGWRLMSRGQRHTVQARAYQGIGTFTGRLPQSIQTQPQCYRNRSDSDLGQCCACHNQTLAASACHTRRRAPPEASTVWKSAATDKYWYQAITRKGPRQRSSEPSSQTSASPPQGEMCVEATCRSDHNGICQ